MQDKNAALIAHPPTRADEPPTQASEPPTNVSEPPPPSEAEKERLAGLRRGGLLDTPPDAGLDRITALAARLFRVPAAIITLVDENRLWFKSRGGSAKDRLPAEISRKDTPCPSALLSPDVFVVQDLRLDPRFRDTPALGPLGVRFYAGAPLVLSDGTAIGTLCLMDWAPRSFSGREQEALRDLAAGAVTEIELRAALNAATENTALYRQMFTDNPYPMWVLDVETLDFLDVNNAMRDLYDYSREELLTMSVLDIRPESERAGMKAFLLSTADSPPRGRRGVWRHQTKSGTPLWVETAAQPVMFGGRRALLAIAQDVTERCRVEDALRRSERRFAAHVRQMPLAAIEMDTALTVTRWNPAAERMFGYTAAEAVGHSVVTLIVPEDEQAHVEGVRLGILSGRGGGRSTNFNCTKSGERILCDWYNSPLTDDAGLPIGCASLVRDITEEAGAQERLRRSEAHKAAILGSALDCIITIDAAGRVTDWNPAAERTFGITAADAEGRPISELILPPPLREAYQDGLLFYLGSGDWPAFHRRIELTAQRGDGTPFFAEMAATTLGSDRPLYTIYLRDITERKAMEQEREALLTQTEALLTDALERADHDPLTGLLNHRAFHKRLNEAVNTAQATGRSGALLLIDLDNFKFFNDAYGHLAGDDVLRRMSQAFASACALGGVLARFGGDEFALLLPSAEAEDAFDQAAALRDAAAGVGYRPPGYETAIPFTLSVGLACFSAGGDADDGGSPAALLEIAAARLRVAKSGGDGDGAAMGRRRALAESVGGFTMLDALVTAVDNKDRYTRRHSEDVMRYSLQIARALGLDAETRHTLEIAALLHDVGKIGVPDAILRKPGALTDDDYEAVKQHPLMGAAIVGAVPGFEEVLDAVRHHHERWDGGGYPGGLTGEKTPLTARLMAVADAYSAMTTDRPYRQGMPAEKAQAILAAGAGTQWDPECVRAFLQTL